MYEWFFFGALLICVFFLFLYLCAWIEKYHSEWFGEDKDVTFEILWRLSVLFILFIALVFVWEGLVGF